MPFHRDSVKCGSKFYTKINFEKWGKLYTGYIVKVYI